MENKKSFLTYCNRRMLVILLLGFSSGLPLALVGGTLQAWFKQAGIDIVTIGFLGLVGQPYSYKFLWAPLMDRFNLPFLGRRRGWILVTQILIILATIIIAFQDPKQHPFLLAGLALLLAFFAASQDIAIDAYRADILQSDERGLGAALGVEGYRLGMIISSGGALILADNIGWQQAYLIMASLVTIGTLAVFIAPEPDVTVTVPKNFWVVIVDSFLDLLKRPYAIAFFALIICYKLGDAFSQSLSTVFLLDMNFSLTAVGTINKGVGLVSSLIGIFLGGVLMTRLGLFRSLLMFGILQAVTNLSYMLLALIGKNYVVAVGAFFIECLCGGMGSAALVALLMSLCNPKFTATQFALFSSLTALGRIYVSPVAGFMVKFLGWATFYCTTAFIAIPGILLILYLKKPINSYADKAQQKNIEEKRLQESREQTPVGKDCTECLNAC